MPPPSPPNDHAPRQHSTTLRLARLHPPTMPNPPPTGPPSTLPVLRSLHPPLRLYPHVVRLVPGAAPPSAKPHPQPLPKYPQLAPPHTHAHTMRLPTIAVTVSRQATAETQQKKQKRKAEDGRLQIKRKEMDKAKIADAITNPANHLLPRIPQALHRHLDPISSLFQSRLTGAAYLPPFPTHLSPVRPPQEAHPQAGALNSPSPEQPSINSSSSVSAAAVVDLQSQLRVILFRVAAQQGAGTRRRPRRAGDRIAHFRRPACC
ncbi:hypothetical protein BDZ97DRAFT_1913702 [Flammula alnicola]|nr:hypothetical protein BDZ97DRAFT_1913702 [Flammula alnicola]